jgi:hypothetical protein
MTSSHAERNSMSPTAIATALCFLGVLFRCEAYGFDRCGGRRQNIHVELPILIEIIAGRSAKALRGG